MSEDAILDYIDSKPFTKNLIQSKWQNNSMVLVLLLNGLMVMVTRFSTVILCLAAGISVLFWFYIGVFAAAARNCAERFSMAEA